MFKIGGLQKKLNRKYSLEQLTTRATCQAKIHLTTLRHISQIYFPLHFQIMFTFLSDSYTFIV